MVKLGWCDLIEDAPQPVSNYRRKYTFPNYYYGNYAILDIFKPLG